MDNRIYELYETLQIPEENWPRYDNPYDFARRIKKCSLTVSVPTTASNSTLVNPNRAIFTQEAKK